MSALRRFFEQAPDGIVAAYLFGGRASGRFHAESDIDVGVVLDRERYPEKAARSRLRVELAGALMAHLASDLVDLVVLNDASPELGRTVVQAGSASSPPRRSARARSSRTCSSEPRTSIRGPGLRAA